MVEEFRKAPVENMDEVIYYVNGTYRLLEFLVSVARGHQTYRIMDDTTSKDQRSYTLDL